MLQNCLFGNIFYQSESDFCTITSRSLKSHFENALKFFHYTYTIEYGETQTHSFSALVPKTEKKSKLAKKCALTCSSISKVHRLFVFIGRENFGNSFYLKSLGIV